MIKNRKIFSKAYSMIEMSIIILGAVIIIVGAYQGYNIYRETIISRSQSLTQNSIINRIPSLLAWFETSNPDSFSSVNELNTGKQISVWLDKTANKTEKFPARAGQKISNTNSTFEPNNSVNPSGPIYIENSINNIPSLRFTNDSSNSRFLVIDPLLKINNGSFTIFLVILFNKPNYPATIIDKVCIKNNQEVTDQELLGIEGCKSNISLKIDSLNNIEFSITNSSEEVAKILSTNLLEVKVPHIVAIERNYNQSIKLYIDGNLIATEPENLNQLYPFPLKIGRHATASNLDYQFDLSELIIFEDVLDERTRNNIENYLEKKYSIIMKN
jgi:hypothetical protein